MRNAERIFHAVKSAVPVVLFVGMLAAALWAAEHELRQLTVAGLIHALRKLSFLQIAAAAGGTVLSYGLLTTYDLLGARVARLGLSPRLVMVVSFIAYTLTNNIGFGTVTGGSVRLRFYTRAGVRVADVVRVFVFCATTFWLGFTLLAGWALWTGEAAHLGRLAFIAPAGPAIGLLLIAFVAAYVILCALWKGHITFRSERIETPPFPLALAQPFLGALDWILAAGVFYVLLPHGNTLSFSAFLHAYLLAQMVGMLSHVPGGLGVFEGLLLFGLGGAIDPAALAASMIAFRCVYYLGPLIAAIIAMTALAAGEGRGKPSA